MWHSQNVTGDQQLNSIVRYYWGCCGLVLTIRWSWNPGWLQSSSDEGCIGSTAACTYNAIIYVILIMSCCKHGFSRLCFSNRFYRISHPQSVHSYCREVLVGCQTLARPCEVFPLKNIAYEFVFTSLTVSCMSCSSDLNGFRDGWLVAVQLLFCGMLLPGFVQYGS